MTLPRSLLRRYVKNARAERLSTSVYAALVDQLFGGGSTVGYMMLVVAATILTSVAYHNDPNRVTATILVAMLIIAVSRIVLLVRYKRWVRRGETRVRQIAAWEIAYAILGVAMALVIGLVAAYTTLFNADPNTLMVSIIVTMGVAGGVTSRNGSRPTIVFAQIAGVMLPFCLALAATGTRQGLIVAFLFGIYFLSTYLSTKAFYASLRTAMSNEQRNHGLKKTIQHTASMFDTALNNMTSGLLMFNANRQLVVVNASIKRMFGREPVEALVGKSEADIMPAIFAMLGTRPQEGEAFLRAFPRMLRDNGEDALALIDHKRRRVYDLRGRIMRDGVAVITVDDVTEQRTREEEIHRLAHHDVLTGLPNRFSLGRHIEKALISVSRDMPLVVAYLDLDNFKNVNDDLGHAAGDTMLVHVAERIGRVKRRNDFAARIAGDEFVLTFEHVTDIEAIERTVQRIIDHISQPYAIAGKVVEIGASAGMTLVKTPDTTSDEVMRLADVALYEAKTHGRGRAFWFDPEMDEKARTRRELTADLKDAIDNDVLTLVYQPTVDFRTGRIATCEALSRWRHPVRGMIPPSEFIALAEESDLIHRIGQWSIRRACLDALAWPDSRVKVAVNLSAVQFKNKSISQTVTDILSATGFPPNRLEIEITESVLADDLESMRWEMNALNRLGVSFSLDDFGTGYSNFSYLHTLPIQKVKLDRMFVTRLHEDPSAVALIASIVQLAQVLRKDLVIEGVETAEELAMITNTQARLFQGFYFSRPVPQDEIIALIDKAGEQPASPYRESA